MSLLPFGSLPAYAPRTVVPEQIDLGDWGELSAALDEESSRRYIAMTCHTDNPDAEKAYLQFVETIEPETKPRQFKLEQLYMGHPLRSKLPRDRYEIFDKHTAVHVELFREENVPLE